MILEVGPWVLLSVGVVLLLSGAYATLKGNGPKAPWIWIFGVLVAGTGVYGPAFMVPYKAFLDALLAVETTTPQAGNTAAFEKAVNVANRMPAKYRKLADARLARAIEVAGSDAKKPLTDLRINRLKPPPQGRTP